MVSLGDRLPVLVVHNHRDSGLTNPECPSKAMLGHRSSGTEVSNPPHVCFGEFSTVLPFPEGSRIGSMLDCVPGAGLQLKILDSVVVRNSVLVVDNLGREKVSSNMLRHNQTVFQDISLLICHRMSRAFNKPITVGMLLDSPVPFRVATTCITSSIHSKYLLPSIIPQGEAVVK